MCNCCRPIYHYDPTTGAVPAGFSPAAINLSVKCIAAGQMKPGEPRSPGAASVMDLSTSNVTSTSPQVGLLRSQIAVLYSVRVR